MATMAKTHPGQQPLVCTRRAPKRHSPNLGAQPLFFLDNQFFLVLSHPSKHSGSPVELAGQGRTAAPGRAVAKAPVGAAEKCEFQGSPAAAATPPSPGYKARSRGTKETLLLLCSRRVSTAAWLSRGGQMAEVQEGERRKAAAFLASFFSGRRGGSSLGGNLGRGSVAEFALCLA